MKRNHLATTFSASCAILLLLGATLVQGATVGSVWLNPVSGDWTDGTKWSSSPVYPNNGSPGVGDIYDVVLGATGDSYAVSLTGFNTIRVDDLLLTSNDATLWIDRGATLEVEGNLLLEGRIATSAGQNPLFSSLLNFTDQNAPQTLSGSGSIVFGHPGEAENRIRASGTLTIGAGILIESSAGLGQFEGKQVVSHGTIHAKAGSGIEIQVEEFENYGLLRVDGTMLLGWDDEVQWKNHGSIEVGNGGKLWLNGRFTREDIGLINAAEGARVEVLGVLDNSGETLDIEQLGLSSPLFLRHGAIQGGIIKSAGITRLHSEEDSRLIGVTVASDLQLSGLGLQASNGMHLDDATIHFGDLFALSFTGPSQNLSGSGTIIFDPSTPTGSSLLRGQQLVIGEDITVRTGTSSRATVEVRFVENHGTIIAESPHTTVRIGAFFPPTTNNEWTNKGVIQSLAGTVVFEGRYASESIGTVQALGGNVVLTGTIENSGRTIRLDQTTGAWDLRAVVIGGRIEAHDGIVVGAAGEWHNVTLAGKALLNMDAPRRAGISVTGSLNFDNGEMVVPDRFAIYGQGPLSFDGVGAVVLNGGAIGHYPGDGVLTIGQHVTLRTGDIAGGGVFSNMHPLVNYGTISAETAGHSLSINRPLINHGTIQNKNQSDLVINSQSWTNEGTILAMGPYRNAGYLVIEATDFDNAESGFIGGTGRLVIPNTTLVNHGTIAPGLSVGTLTIGGNVELTDTSVLDFEIGANGLADRLIVQGSLELGGMFQLAALPDFSMSNLNPITVLSTSGGIIQGQFDNVGPIRLGGHDFHIHYGFTSVWLTPSVAEVPEPGCLGTLLAVGIVAAAGFRRRRSHGLRARGNYGDLP